MSSSIALHLTSFETGSLSLNLKLPVLDRLSGCELLGPSSVCPSGTKVTGIGCYVQLLWDAGDLNSGLQVFGDITTNKISSRL